MFLHRDWSETVRLLAKCPVHMPSVSFYRLPFVCSCQILKLSIHHCSHSLLGSEIKNRPIVGSVKLLSKMICNEVTLFYFLYNASTLSYCIEQPYCADVCMYVSFGQGSSLLWTHTLRPFYSRPIALTQEGRSLLNDVCKCVRD